MALCVAAAAHAESAKVIKVLPHFLDEKGRHTLHPSLYERDAYQEQLRGKPEKRTALRFDIQWKAHGPESLKLRLEAKGGQGHKPSLITLEKEVSPGIFSRWTGLILAGDAYKDFGELISWRATLWSGTNQVAEQKSFLW